MQNYLLVTILFFALIGVLHLLRAFFGWQVTIHRYSVPRVLSLIAAFVAFVLACWGISQFS